MRYSREEMQEGLAISEELPSVVILGRPNVGKSTLFNRLIGARRSIVTDESGITRDRIYGTAVWQGRRFQVVDTGGILPEEKEFIPREIFRQARVAIERAAQLVLVVDARAGVNPLDGELARLLRKTGKPLAIAANKVDSPQQAALAAAFYGLGKDVYPVSAEHGLGVDELLEAITAGLPALGMPSEEASPRPLEAEPGVVVVAIIGRPNVGKSTLLNQLVGEERAIVSPEPGTTRDAVDTWLRRDGKTYRFVDTAGIRRKGKTKLVAEKLSVVMARKHLERCDVALLVLDAAQGITAGDATIAGYAAQSGRSLILVMNKWDAALAAAQRTASGKTRKAEVDRHKLLRDYEEILRAKLRFLSYAPVVFVSALTGKGVDRLLPLIDRVAAARRRRISTGELNRWLRDVDLERGTSPASRRVKIYYITQASASPPTFVLFTNQTRPLHFSYERFLENQLRARFDFPGTPIFFRQRLKKR